VEVAAEAIERSHFDPGTHSGVDQKVSPPTLFGLFPRWRPWTYRRGDPTLGAEHGGLDRTNLGERGLINPIAVACAHCRAWLSIGAPCSRTNS